MYVLPYVFHQWVMEDTWMILVMWEITEKIQEARERQLRAWNNFSFQCRCNETLLNLNSNR